MASRTAGAGTTSDSCLEPPSSTAASPDWSRHDRGRKRRPEMSIRRGTPVARRARMARALAVAMAAAVLGVSGARASAGRQVSGEADQDHRAVRARRLGRHPGARDWAETDGALAPADHRRDAAGRRYHDWNA